LEKHLFEGEINDKWEASGVHSKIAIDRWTARIETWTIVQLWKGFYSAKVRVFNQDLYNELKSNYDKWKADPRNNWKEYTYMKVEDFWRKLKKDPSTFFPDDRGEEKIKEEISEAYANMKIETVIKDGVTKIYYWWKMSDWNYIEFQLGIDWNIKSTYPNFQQDFINLFK